MDYTNRSLACILAGACGDALGYPVEHKRWEKIKSIYGEGGIRTMKVEDGIARITDDTQMTIYTAQGLIHARRKKCTMEDTVKEVHMSYLRWYSSLLHCGDAIADTYSPFYPREELLTNDLLDNGKNPGLDTKMCRGGSTFEALESGECYSTSNPPPSGVRCGCTMRAAPIAIAFHSDPEAAFKMGCECAAITHGHRSAYLSAGVMCMLIAKLLNGDECVPAVHSSLQYLKQLPRSDSLYDVLMKGVVLGTHPNANPHDDIASIGLGWRADENLAIALYCLIRYKKDVKSALIACVNHDGDSDSVAAVCGNVMGAYSGMESIPPEWLAHLQFRDLLKAQTEALCSTDPSE